MRVVAGVDGAGGGWWRLVRQWGRRQLVVMWRVPMQAAYPEKEGPAYLTLRGQGGEEIAMAVVPAAGGTRVRASTLLFDQTVDRFFSTLPASSEPAA